MCSTTNKNGSHTKTEAVLKAMLTLCYPFSLAKSHYCCLTQWQKCIVNAPCKQNGSKINSIKWLPYDHHHDGPYLFLVFKHFSKHLTTYFSTLIRCYFCMFSFSRNYCALSLARYNWYIVESGVKHYNPTPYDTNMMWMKNHMENDSYFVTYCKNYAKTCIIIIVIGCSMDARHVSGITFIVW
jgi:hypothetical protein